MANFSSLQDAAYKYIDDKYIRVPNSYYSSRIGIPDMFRELYSSGPITIPNLISTADPRTVVQTSKITNSSSSDITKTFSFSETVTDTVTSSFETGFELGISREVSVGATIQMVKLDAKQTISTKFSLKSTQTTTNTKTRTWVEQYTVPVKADTQATIVYTLSIGSFDGFVDVDLKLSGNVLAGLIYSMRGEIANPGKGYHEILYIPIVDIVRYTNPTGFTVNPDNTVSFKGKLRLQGELGIMSELFVHSKSLTTGVTTTIPLSTQTAPPTILFA
ncbi:ETX/MTX2 family pore-forming toxin [Bacillus thuringiensis]|uniref:ETX/MTX2 family pore-forming toxin n=1 Tax=Bacillus thuringiensis TaxID=1428 RepID=UPI0011A756C7|nr:ETX/MTX2 family pore-forming toxin [Bacillus thuringiensis]